MSSEKKIYVGETGRRLGDRLREHLRDVERNDEDAAKPVARHFNLPNKNKKFSKMTVEISRGGGGKGKKSPVGKWELGKAIFAYWRKESLQFTLPYWFSGKIAKLPSAHWPREVL